MPRHFMPAARRRLLDHAAMLTRGDCVSGTRTDVGIGNAQTASILTNMCTN